MQLSSQLWVRSHIRSTSPRLPAGAASPCLSPSFPIAARVSSSPLHAVLMSPCPNHSPLPCPCPLHPGSPQQTPHRVLHGWPCLLHPPPHSHAGVVSTCTKTSFCQAAGLFVAAISLLLPGEPAAPGDSGALERAPSASGLCQLVSLPACHQRGSSRPAQVGAQPPQHSPALTPSKVSPLAASGATPGCPILGLMGFPRLYQAFCPHWGTAQTFPRHPKWPQGCLPAPW